MSLSVEAIYENGVIKLPYPLPFQENERVRVTIEKAPKGGHSVLDIEPVDLGEVLKPLSSNDDLLDEMLRKD